MFSDKILRQFSLLGRYFYLIFVIYIISFASFFAGMLSMELYYLFTIFSSLFQVLLVLLIVIQVIRINSILKDKNLRMFICSLVVYITVLSLNSVFSPYFYLLVDIYSEFYWIFIFSYLITFGLFFYTAWYNLEKFFDKNRNSFPNAVAQDAVLAINNVKKATLLFILIIPAIFGVILYVKGCLMLADALKKL